MAKNNLFVNDRCVYMVSALRVIGVFSYIIGFIVLLQVIIGINMVVVPSMEALSNASMALRLEKAYFMNNSIIFTFDGEIEVPGEAPGTISFSVYSGNVVFINKTITPVRSTEIVFNKSISVENLLSNINKTIYISIILSTDYHKFTTKIPYTKLNNLILNSKLLYVERIIRGTRYNLTHNKVTVEIGANAFVNKAPVTVILRDDSNSTIASRTEVLDIMPGETTNIVLCVKLIRVNDIKYIELKIYNITLYIGELS